MTVSTKTPSDPRIRRTRRLLQDALIALIERKGFADISITDICKEADIARVTFYQHYESKEALLLASVADFFSAFDQTIDFDNIDHYLKTGEVENLALLHADVPVDVARVKLVGIALRHVGSEVRKMTLPTFVAALTARETDLSGQEIEVLASFYTGGILTLLEQFLNGELPLTPQQFQATTLPFLRSLRAGVIEANIFGER